jgi:phage gpG-like protein
MTPEQFTKNLTQMSVDVNKFFNDTGSNGAPTIVGKTAVDFFTQNFDRQGFLNRELTSWTDVKRRTHPRKSPRGKTAAGRRILFGETRNLSRSIDYDPKKGNVIVYSDVHYAPYHNEGTSKIPQRQFIGDSAELDKLVVSELERKLNNIIK